MQDNRGMSESEHTKEKIKRGRITRILVCNEEYLVTLVSIFRECFHLRLKKYHGVSYHKAIGHISSLTFG